MTEQPPNSHDDRSAPDASLDHAPYGERHSGQQHVNPQHVEQRSGPSADEFAPPTPGAERTERSAFADSPGTSSKVASRPVVVGRRRGLPLILLGLTVLSTFWAGASQWMPMILLRCFLFDGEGHWVATTLMPVRRAIVSHWEDGLIYAVCVLGILLTHEMGHFLATLCHRIPASFPFCIPFPISPIGTLGAVIAMDGRQADRKQLFDIGLAGPLAGLVVAVPVMWIGIQQLDVRDAPPAVFTLESPLGVRMVLNEVQPPGYEIDQRIPNSRLNPYFMAGWVGLLITGLNMLPVSQLDGGHVIYALLGKWSYWVARGLVVLAIAWSVYHHQVLWVLMIGLVLLIGTDHPRTRDDRTPLGWFRIALGVASLAIPVICFSPMALATGMGG